MNKVLVITAISLAIVVPQVHASLYKWVDEKGQVHFGDSIPLKYREKEHTVLSDKGLRIKKQKALPTEEELVEERRLKAERKERDKKVKAQKQRDRVLLDTYTTERDLVAARDARIEAVDSQIQLSESIVADSKTNLEKSVALAASLKAQNKTVPPTLLAKIEREKRTLELNQKLAEGHIEKRAKVTEQFDGYIERFKELLADKKRKREELEARRNEVQPKRY